MSIHSRLIARFNLSGTEEFCNTIATNDAALRWRIEHMRTKIAEAKSHQIPEEATYSYNSGRTLELTQKLIEELDQQANEQLLELHINGYSIQEGLGHLDDLYEFLLDTKTADSRYNMHIDAIDRLTEQIKRLDYVLYLELKQYNSPRPVEDVCPL